MNHWKSYYNNDYLGAFTLHEVSNKSDLVVTIKAERKEMVKGEGGREKSSLILEFEELDKPYICNKTNSERIARLTNSPNPSDWVGRKIQLYIETDQKLLKNRTDEALWVRPYVPKVSNEDRKKELGLKIRAALEIYQGADKDEIRTELNNNRDDLMFLENTLEKLTKK